MTEATSPDTERGKPMYGDWRDTIANMARADRKLRFTTLAHRLTPEFLKEAYKRLNRRKAPGLDGLTVEAYGERLDERIDELWERLRSGRYRPRPVRRVYIPKANGKKRPLGIANVEDRLVQMALSMVLEPIYEQDFTESSYGFRPRRSTHDALEVLRKTVDRKPIRVIFEADIAGFFDNLDHEWLRKFIAHRVADGRIQDLIDLTLTAGVQEHGKVTRGDKGSPQGSPLSPMLANIYLHYVLDVWFEKRFRPGCRGVAEIVRYADDFVVSFERPEEAERFRGEVEARFAKFGLELVNEKTRQVEFGRSRSDKEPGPGDEPRTFDFLGFTHYMRRRGTRRQITARKPSKKRRRSFLADTKAWLKKNMHGHPRFQQRKLGEKLRGFYQYFGLRYCKPALQGVRRQVERIWKRILERRSQRGKRTWKQWKLKPWFRLPAPRLRTSKRPRRPMETGTTPRPVKAYRRSRRPTEAGTAPRPVSEDRQMPLFPGLARA